MRELKVNNFIGTWKLISFEEKKNDEIIYPFGKNAIGYIIYTSDLHVSVQFMSKDRTKFLSDDRYKATEKECLTIFKEYFGYFGRYEIDNINNIINHKIEGHIFSNTVGSTFSRKFEFINNTLKLTMINDPNKYLIWEKLNIDDNLKNTSSYSQKDTSLAELTVRFSSFKNNSIINSTDSEKFEYKTNKSKL